MCLTEIRADFMQLLGNLVFFKSCPKILQALDFKVAKVCNERGGALAGTSACCQALKYLHDTRNCPFKDGW